MVHRDLKAENIFIVNNHCVKVGDFGFSKSVTFNSPLTTFCGSPPYAAPELFVADSYIGTAVDLWALGVLIFYMVCGYLPFNGDTVQKIKRLILAGQYKIPSTVSISCHTVIKGLLMDCAETRFKIEQVKNSIWFNKICWSDFETENETNKEGLDDHNVRNLLKHWWTIENVELDRAIQQGPKNKLTGIYRILCHKGNKFAYFPPQPNYILSKKSNKQRKSNGIASSNKGKANVEIPLIKEMTTVDLRDEKPNKGKSHNDNGGSSSRSCNIL